MTAFGSAKSPSQPRRPAGPPATSEIKGSGTKAPAAPNTLSPSLSHDRIAQRAYEIYARRGYAPGNPDEDWLEAERQLRAGF